MSRLSAQSIRKLNVFRPFNERTTHNGMTYGLGPASYDVRIREGFILWPGRSVLASTIEHFTMPNHVAAAVRDKSTWIRRFVSVHNTDLDPGWNGHLTLEITNHSWWFRVIKPGDPIAAIIFEPLDEPTEIPYSAKDKYQDQPPRPVHAILKAA